MFRHIKFFILSVFIISIAALLQSSELVSFNGIKVNVVLAAVLTTAFFLDSFWYYMLASSAGIVLLSPGVNHVSLLFLFLAIISFLAKRYLTLQTVLNNLFLICIGTVVVYIILDYQFLLNHTATVMIEALYNMCAGMFFYGMYKLFV